ncbi:glycoside hydrolase family 114 protein, partial [Amniculicola lignicola CBS 123094]
DIDLDDNSEEGDTTIKDLAKTKKIICYFSAGSVEDWRNDYPDFLPEDIGQPMKDWPGEWWLNVNSPNVKAIMKKRIERAAKAGCHAVDPDNVDGYGSNHQDGFTYPQADYVEYMKYLADLAHQNNMAIGLKNAVEIIPALVSTVDFFVNEQCHNLDFNECWKYKPATDAGKAVFNIEY